MRPEACARGLADATEKALPDDWTTDDLATFWHRLTEACVLRLVRLKPEMVSRWPPEE